MADSTLTIKTADGDLVPISVRLTPAGGRRQVVVVGDGETDNLLSPATEDTLAAVLAALGQTGQTGQTVALDAATLAALETITVGNLPSDPSTETTLAAILTELGQKLEQGQAVALDAASLAALESVTATISGPVEVDNASGGPLGVKQTGVAPPLGYQQVAALTASQALPTIPGGAVTAIVTPRAPVRWRDDGTAPTATVGMYLAADQPLTYQGNLAAVRLIAVSGSVEVNVAYYGAEA